MKNLHFLLFLIFLCTTTQAQPARPEKSDKKSADLRKIQAMEMAFITRELNLSPDEAQKFWPLFNQYRNDIKGASADRKVIDQLDRQQKMLDVRKKYREDFTKMMTQERANKVFGAEDEFKSLIRREFQKRQSEKKQFEGRKKNF